jgi:hypothetical protein
MYINVIVVLAFNPLQIYEGKIKSWGSFSLPQMMCGTTGNIAAVNNNINIPSFAHSYFLLYFKLMIMLGRV